MSNKRQHSLKAGDQAIMTGSGCCMQEAWINGNWIEFHDQAPTDRPKVAFLSFQRREQ